MENLTETESLLLQCVATPALFGALSSANYLSSDNFKGLNFHNPDLKSILVSSGLGNPAMMQMMLYSLLVVPNEIMKNDTTNTLETYLKKENPEIFRFVESSTKSTYKNETINDNIDFIRHIRNAVAHSKCKYWSKNNKNYVTFSDDNNKTSEKCDIIIECCKVGSIMHLLENATIQYCRDKHIIV